MNLAFCIFKYYPFGGLERNFLRILEESLQRENSVSIFTMEWNGDVPCFIQKYPCKIIKIPFSGISNHAQCASYVKNLSPKLKENNFDLVVGFNRMPGLDLYYCADVCFKADVRKRRSAFFKLTPRYKVYAEFEKNVFFPQSSTHILALSHIQKEIYQKEYETQEERFHPIPAGIDKIRIRECVGFEKRIKYRQELGVNDNEKMLVMVGSDFIRKGVQRTIQALGSLPCEERKIIKLFVIGKGKESMLKSLAEQLGLPNQVIFTGGINNVPHYLSAADLLLHPAVAENTGNSIVEALIAGVPVIATSNCGYAIHVQESGAGTIVDGDKFSQQELDSALKEFIRKPEEEIKKLKTQAFEYSDNTDFYSRPQVVADIIETLKKSKSQ